MGYVGHGELDNDYDSFIIMGSLVGYVGHGEWANNCDLFTVLGG